IAAIQSIRRFMLALRNPWVVRARRLFFSVPWAWQPAHCATNGAPRASRVAGGCTVRPVDSGLPRSYRKRGPVRSGETTIGAVMKNYLLSVCYPEGGTPPEPEALERIMEDVRAVEREMRAAGAWVFSGGLHPSSTATV